MGYIIYGMYVVCNPQCMWFVTPKINPSYRSYLLTLVKGHHPVRNTFDDSG